MCHSTWTTPKKQFISSSSSVPHHDCRVHLNKASGRKFNLSLLRDPIHSPSLVCHFCLSTAHQAAADAGDVRVHNNNAALRCTACSFKKYTIRWTLYNHEFFLYILQTMRKTWPRRCARKKIFKSTFRVSSQISVDLHICVGPRVATKKLHGHAYMQ